MKTIKAVRSRLGIASLVAVVAMTACQDEQPTLLDTEALDLAPEAAVASFELSSLTARPGETLTLALNLDAPEGTVLGAAQGYVRWNASALDFVGQITTEGTVAFLNDSRAGAGEIRFASFGPRGMVEDVVTLAFEVRASGYDRGLSSQFEVVRSLDYAELDVRFEETSMASLPSALLAERLDYDAWVERLAPGESSGPLMVQIGEASIFGDANNSGAPEITDALQAARIGVGNPDASCFGGSPTVNVDCFAANVFPFNTGGGGSDLGDAADDCAPGLDDCADGSSQVVDVSDALPIAREGVGDLQPIVGEAIPGLATPTDTACVFGTFVANNPGGPGCSGANGVEFLVADQTLGNDFVWVLDAEWRVGDDGTQGVCSGTTPPAGCDANDVVTATLTIEPGTRVLGTDSAAIIVTRAGRLIARGSQYDPVEFSCYADEPTGSGREPACWRGVYIAGNAPINELFVDGDGMITVPAAVPIPSRNSGTATNQFLAEGLLAGTPNLFYGGDNDADSCGEIRYATFSYGGLAVSANNELNNLTIGACGTGTVLEYVQAHAGTDDGVELFGGSVSASHILATANQDDQVDYNLGYDGTLQFIAIQMLTGGDDENGDKGFEVDGGESNLTVAEQQAGGEVTNAQVWNVTFIGGTDAVNDKKAFNYRKGGGGTLQNMLVLGAADVFDVDDASSCDRIGDPTFPMNFDYTVILASTAITSGCTTSGGNATALQDDINAKRATNGTTGVDEGTIQVRATYGGELVDPFNVVLPDFRPVGSGVTLIGQTIPTPPVGFAPANYLGAVAPQGLGGGFSWTSGWTRGWFSSSTP